MGASFFLLGQGSLRIQLNFLETHPTFHDQFKCPLEEPS